MASFAVSALLVCHEPSAPDVVIAERGLPIESGIELEQLCCRLLLWGGV